MANFGKRPALHGEYAATRYMPGSHYHLHGKAVANEVPTWAYGLQSARELLEGDRDLPASELLKRLLRFETAIERMSHGVCFFDGAHRLLLANQRYAELYGLQSNAIHPGMDLREIAELRLKNGIFPKMTAGEYVLWRGEVATRNEPSETVVELANGCTILIKHQPMPDGGWVATHEDITEQRRAAARISYIADHDALTGLANRLLFRKILEEACSAGHEADGPALLCLDLDRFKQVNDTLGHPVGDLLLRAVSGRLLSQVGEGNTVARLGGDEFAIICKRSTAREAADLANRIIDALGRTFELDGHRVEIGGSVGIARSPMDGTDADELLGKADQALYRAKDAGRRCFRFFEPEVDQRMHVRQNLGQDLRDALRTDALELHYQPMVDVATRHVLGFEALLRWRHPDRGLMMPQTFIPLAEGADLIVPLGDWVLRRACGDMAALPAPTKVSVNVSPIQLTPDLPGCVAAVLQASRLDPSRLELEITETAMLRETEATLNVLHQLRALGVGIVMDDFGTGFSSLSALQRFPFTKVKIDRSFTQDLGKNPVSEELLRAIVGLCRVLQMPATVEGIETEEQFACLAACGCTEVQGFLLGRPAPLDTYHSPAEWSPGTVVSA